MREIQIAGNNYSLVSSWEEVDPDLLLRIIPHVYATDREQAKAALVPILSDIPHLVLIQLAGYQYARIAELCDWVWEQPLTIPIIPEIEHNGEIWKLPSECLYDSPFIEYDHLYNFLREVGENDADTDRIIATILRPVGIDGKRILFDGMQVDALVIKLKDLPDIYKAYCLIFATGCMRYIHEEYGILWEEDKTTPIRDSRYSLQEGKDIDFSWTGVAFQIAEVGVFGRYLEVIFSNCHTVLYYLAWKKQQAIVIRKAN